MYSQNYSPYGSPAGSGGVYYSPAGLSSPPSQPQPFHLSPADHQRYTPPTPQLIRETGFIHGLEPSSFIGYVRVPHFEKILSFHFSQVQGNPTQLQEGQQVNLEVLHDYQTNQLRTHKIHPLAIPSPIKGPNHSRRRSLEPLSKQRSRGRVDSEAIKRHNMPSVGRIIYEHNSECYFVQYSMEDVEGDSVVRRGDEVSFILARDISNDTMQAISVVLEVPASVKKIQGLVKTLKDSFGFIERADIAEMVFFHFSEIQQSQLSQLIVGASVEFVLQNRQGKQVATQIKVLKFGTVSYDIIDDEVCYGVIRKSIRWSINQKKVIEPLNDDGEIFYQSPREEGMLPISYSARDQIGYYSILPRDKVTFNITTDRRTKQKRATNVTVISLCEVQGDKGTRDRGIVSMINEDIGYIECSTRNVQVDFPLFEVMDQNQTVKEGDEVEYSYDLPKEKDSVDEGTAQGIRVQLLPRGTVKLDSLTSQVYQGVVAEELTSVPKEDILENPLRLLLLNSEDCGSIHYTGKTGKLGVVPFFYDPKEPELEFGDHIEFRIAKVKRTKEQRAVEIRVTQKARDMRFKGFISRLIKKENYGFIESEEHDCEIFFSFSAYNGEAADLSLLDEVEYCIVRKAGKTSADKVLKMAAGTIPKDEAVNPGDQQLIGEVIRPLRSGDNGDYEGLVRYKVSKASTDCSIELPYTVTSLTDIRNLPKQGEQVTFDLAVTEKTGRKRAVNVSVKREVMKGVVDNLKEQYGFIAYTSEDNEKATIFFHKSNLSDKTSDVHVGDEVEFVIVTQHRTPKRPQAINVKKTGITRRPERLSRRSLQTTRNQQSASSLVDIIREPRGPDGSKGFTK